MTVYFLETRRLVKWHLDAFGRGGWSPKNTPNGQAVLPKIRKIGSSWWILMIQTANYRFFGVYFSFRLRTSHIVENVYFAISCLKFSIFVHKYTVTKLNFHRHKLNLGRQFLNPRKYHEQWPCTNGHGRPASAWQSLTRTTLQTLLSHCLIGEHLSPRAVDIYLCVFILCFL